MIKHFPHFGQFSSWSFYFVMFPLSVPKDMFDSKILNEYGIK